MAAMTPAPKPTSITEDGHRDADVANMESWEDMSRASLIHKIEEGIRELDRGEKMSVDETITIIEENLCLAGP